MAACGSLQHIFEKPLPENPTLLEALSSWKQIKPTKPVEDSSFTEIFGELHFKENHPQESSLPSPTTLPLSSSSSSSSSLSSFIQVTPQLASISNNNELLGSTKSPSSEYFSSTNSKQYHKNNDSFSSMNSESLQLCTEGLGFESSGDVDDLKIMNINCDWPNQEERSPSILSITKHYKTHENLSGDPLMRRMKTGSSSISSGGGGGGALFPPPISCIGESGKPGVCFKSYRQDGRFVLKEIRIPTKEFLHARREDGRLKLQFFQSDDEILEEEEEEEVEEEEEEQEYEEEEEEENEDGHDHESNEIHGEEEEESAENNEEQINTNEVGGDMP